MPKTMPTLLWWKSINANAVAEAAEEATVDCYRDEALSGLVSMVVDELETPFPGKVLGQDINVIEVTSASTTGNDFDFICESNGKRFVVAARSVALSKRFPEGHLCLAALFDYQSR